MSLLFCVICLPSALALDLNVDAGFYFKQSRSGTCTLASAAMMLRRRAYLDGLGDWVDVTENSVRSGTRQAPRRARRLSETVRMNAIRLIAARYIHTPCGIRPVLTGRKETDADPASGSASGGHCDL